MPSNDGSIRRVQESNVGIFQGAAIDAQARTHPTAPTTVDHAARWIVFHHKISLQYYSGVMHYVRCTAEVAAPAASPFSKVVLVVLSVAGRHRHRSSVPVVELAGSDTVCVSVHTLPNPLELRHHFGSYMQLYR